MTKPENTSRQAVKNEPPRRFLTIDQVAGELSVSDAQVRALLRTGELRGIQVGGRGLWRIGAQDLEDYIEAAYDRTAARIAAGDLASGEEAQD